MNKLRLFCILALSSVLFMGYLEPAFVHAAGSTNLDVFIANTTPNPVEPGENLLLNIIIKNSGDITAESATATLKAKYPFSVKTIQNEVIEKNICSGCSSSITYALSVDSSAVSGSYPLELEVSYGGTGVSRIFNKKTVDLNVIGVPRITFESSISEKITPNAGFEVEFVFKNRGTGNAKDVKVSTSSQDFVIEGGTPVIDSLLAGESKKMKIRFISSPDIVPNVYSIPISLNYLDELNNQKESSSNLGLQVFGNSDLIVKNVKIEPEHISSGGGFTLIARVQNIGYGDAKEVMAELESPYEGYKKAFIGKLEKDEDAPAIFNLVADAGTSDAVLKITYRDDFGEHEKTESIRINVSGGSGTIMYYLLAAVAIVAVIFRKRIIKILG